MTCSHHSVQEWVVAFIHGGIEEVKIKKTPRGLKSRVTDENKEIILSCYLIIHISLVTLEIHGV